MNNKNRSEADRPKSNWKYLLERTFTYSVALASSSVMLYALLEIHLSGYVKFIEPNQCILTTEIIMVLVGLFFILNFIYTDILTYYDKLPVVFKISNSKQYNQLEENYQN